VDAGLRLVRGVSRRWAVLRAARSRRPTWQRRSGARPPRNPRGRPDRPRDPGDVLPGRSHLSALQEQSNGSSFIIGQTEKMKDISRQVRGAIGEQRQGARTWSRRSGRRSAGGVDRQGDRSAEGEELRHCPLDGTDSARDRNPGGFFERTEVDGRGADDGRAKAQR